MIEIGDFVVTVMETIATTAFWTDANRNALWTDNSHINVWQY